MGMGFFPPSFREGALVEICKRMMVCGDGPLSPEGELRSFLYLIKVCSFKVEDMGMGFFPPSFREGASVEICKRMMVCGDGPLSPKGELRSFLYLIKVCSFKVEDMGMGFFPPSFREG